MSRYVGVVRFQLDDGALVDFVCDTNDTRREYPRRAPVLSRCFRSPRSSCLHLRKRSRQWLRGRWSFEPYDLDDVQPVLDIRDLDPAAALHEQLPTREGYGAADAGSAGKSRQRRPSVPR